MAVSRNPLRMSSLYSARMPFARRKEPEGVIGLTPFLNLVRELAGLLAPVAPRETFRSELEQGLLAAARQQSAQLSLGAITNADDGSMRRPDGVSNRVVIGAAAVGSAVSIVGLVAYMLYRRGERTA